jgi:serine protease inhibitor
MAAVVVLLVLGLAAGCLGSPPPRDEEDYTGKERLKEITPEIRAVIQADSDFALDLYARLAADKPGESLFFSPYSLTSALTMVAEGARGETAEEMGKVLRYPASAHRNGDDAQDLPWEMSRIHTALAALNDHFTSGNRSAPREVREKLNALWGELKTANQRVGELQKTGKWQEGQELAGRTQRLADEINKLQAPYNQYELRIANALWGEKSYGFKPSYFEVLNKHYHTGGCFPVDFRNDFESARQRINAWVEDQTNHRIKDMLPRNVLDEETKKLVRLILTNAIYFKGEWEEVFQESQTKDDDFLLPGSKKVRVAMMAHSGMKAARYAAFHGDGSLFVTPQQISRDENDPKKLYPDDQGFQMLELPYKSNEVSMVVLLPRSADGLTALEKKLKRGDLQNWIDKMVKREVHVFVPKFKLETKYAMEDTLKHMGMVRAFVDPREANGAQFDGMSESSDPMQKLYISKVLHKAFVEVNEKGTEAAAATAVIMAAATAAPVNVPFTPVFKADRPFVFLIRDVKTGSILFLGRMMNPKQS